MRNLKIITNTLLLMFLCVVLLTTLGLLVAGKRYVIYLSELPREEAYELVKDRVSLMESEYLAIEDLSSEQLEALINSYLGKDLASFTEFDALIVKASDSTLFYNGGRAICCFAIVSQIWLELWQAKKMSRETWNNAEGQ